MTPRRLEALVALRRAAEQAGGAVHYSLVAAGMRISAWTAYDLLRDLEDLGLARRLSGQRGPGPGRSPILFAPTVPAPDPANAAQQKLRQAFERFSIADDMAAVREYLAEPAADLGMQLGFWLSRVSAAGRYVTDAAIAVLEGGSAPSAKIQAVTALGLGATLAHLSQSRLARRVNRAAAAFAALLEERASTQDASLEPLVSAARALAVPVPSSQ